MKCPLCKEEKDFDLVETSDDYQDGEIICLNCGEVIATFNFLVDELDDLELEDDNDEIFETTFL